MTLLTLAFRRGSGLFAARESLIEYSMSLFLRRPSNIKVGRKTHSAIVTDQFTRLRDGDRFWYQNAGFSSSDLAMIERTTLGEILEANSAAVGLQPNAFKVCIADFNHSGNVSNRDRDDFMEAYTASAEDADLNQDGVVDRTDLDEFLSKFAAGC